jgi:hypothetical protein
MKFQFKNLAYLFIAGMIGFTSCGEDNENVPAPTLTFTSGGAASASFNSNETASFSMDLNSNDDYKSLKATLSYTDNSGSVKTSTVKDANNSNKEIDYTKNSDIKTSYGGAKVVKVALPADAKKGTAWTITVVVANSGGSTTATFTGTIVNSWSAKLLGAQDNSSKPSFFASVDGNTYGAAAAALAANAPKIDIGYAFGNFASTGSDHLISYTLATSTAGFGTPAPATATETKFVETTISESSFLDESISWSSLWTGVTPNTTSVKIFANKVYAFKNGAGKYGLIHIESITSGIAGEIKINVKSGN